jgi:hypothetical protein
MLGCKVTHKLEWIYKGILKYPSIHFQALRKIMKTLSRQLVSQPRFKPSTSKVQIKSLPLYQGTHPRRQVRFSHHYKNLESHVTIFNLLSFQKIKKQAHVTTILCVCLWVLPTTMSEPVNKFSQNFVLIS